MKADLHTHSYFSDGDFSPSELVSMAKDAGLGCIALTDHDSVAGVNEAVQAGMGIGIQVVPGVEVKTSHGEIIGLFVDVDDPGLASLLASNLAKRKQQVLSVISLLNDDGYAVDFDEVRSLYPKGYPMFIHVVELCVKKGYFEGVQSAWNDLFCRGKRYSVPADFPSMEDVISVVKSAGGIAIVAHPWLDGYDSYLFGNIDRLVSLGLDGMEDECSLYDPGNRWEVAENVRKICSEKCLVMSRGSDFHKHGLGAPLGRVFCDFSVVEQMKLRLSPE